MLSKLNSIRPSNRRSATPSAAAPPQASTPRYYHEAAPIPYHSSFDPSLPPPRASQFNGLSEASSVSSGPPILPPILRVTSHDEQHIQNAERSHIQDERHPFSHTPQIPSQEGSTRPSNPVLNDGLEGSIAATRQQTKASPEAQSHLPAVNSEQPRPAQSRRKRPIDIAYESMRAYTEPPRRQSFGNISDHVFLPLQSGYEPPPPIPKLSNPPPPPQRQAPPPPVKAQAQEPPTVNQKNPSKAKLNLLNPIALLARRRSSQAVEEAYSQSQSTPRLPDDFDPRIRGKKVHDFSAPRPSRPVSSNEAAKEFDGSPETRRKRALPSQDESSPSTIEKEHTPVFKENFDDNVDSWSSDMDSPAKRKSSAFMYQVSLQASEPPDPSSLPAFARNLPSNVANGIDALKKASSPPPKAPLEVLIEPPAPNQKSAKSSPPTSPPKTRSRATSINDVSFQVPGSPQRFKSNASRFSFDLAGVGSAAQEKLLEEKHRQKAKRKERESVQFDHEDLDDDDEYANYDFDDSGLEEQIPGVNTDAEDSEIPALQRTLEHLQFTSPNKSSFESGTSHASTDLTSPATPRDSQGHSVGLTVSNSSPNFAEAKPEDHEIQPKKVADSSQTSNSRGMPDADPTSQPLQGEYTSETALAGLPRRYDQDDDMYFDDGMIEDFDDGEAQVFDESVFDDDTSRVYGLPLRDLKALPKSLDQHRFPENQLLDTGNYASQTVNAHKRNGDATSPPRLSSDDDTMAEMRDSVADLNPPKRAPSTSQITGLTQDNLGLHDRLAFAANQAAIEGKFNRAHSQTSTHESHDGPNSSLGTATQENHLNSQIDGLKLARGNDDYDDFVFDDVNAAFTEAEDDDPIIAAANAEALENDDDGFYGQEFGFFARKPGSSESEYANGGYFGARALEGIHRMNSGRGDFLEPSLTPITERSEWSNRNSMVSLAMHGYPLSAQYQSNPQLAELMRVQEGEEMSLEALRKLRHSAWGGSDGSLQSSSNSQNGGSPLTYLPPGMAAPFMQPTNSNNSLMSPGSQNLAGSFHSFSSGGQASSNDSDPSPSGDSPTITISPSQSGLMIQPHPIGPPPPPPTDSSLSARRSSSNPIPWAPGHSRASSGAESVSYREENGRWFCERTRLIEETGEVEVLGRSVVEGGRI